MLIQENQIRMEVTEFVYKQIKNIEENNVNSKKCLEATLKNFTIY